MYAAGKAPAAEEVDAAHRDVLPALSSGAAAEIARVRKPHGYAILLDGHSIRGEVPRFFAGRLPDLNLGTAIRRELRAEAQALAAAVLAASPVSRTS